jgi:hypothetical protein
VAVSIASAAPAARASATLPAMSALAMPRRRCVGETVTELTAQPSTLRPPGTVSPAGQPDIVATGVSRSAAFGS